jgi:hypothetical protein
MHARLAAKNQKIDDLPILITPHPLNDLTPDQLKEMAVAAFPVILEQLTGQGVLALNHPIDYVHPAVSSGLHCIDPNLRGDKS